MINKMPTKSELKDEFQEVITKLLGKGNKKGRRNTTVNALIDLYKFNPDTATGEKYDKLIEKLEKYSKKTAGNSALFKIPTTRADINRFIEQQILPMKDPDTFSQSVEDLLQIPSSPTEQSTTTTTRAEREIEKGRNEARDTASLRALQKLKDSGAGAGAQEEEKEDGGAVAGAGLGDSSGILTQNIQINPSTTTTEGGEQGFGLTRADRVANNAYTIPEPSLTIQQTKERYVRPEVSVEQGLQTVNYKSSSVDDVKRKFAQLISAEEDYDDAQNVVRSGSDAVYTTQMDGDQIADLGYVPDPVAQQSAQNLQTVETLEAQSIRLANSASAGNRASSNMMQDVYGVINNELRSVARNTVEGLIDANLPNTRGSIDAMLPVGERAQARAYIEADIGIPVIEEPLPAIEASLDNLPDIVRNELRRTNQSTAQINRAIGRDSIRLTTGLLSGDGVDVGTQAGSGAGVDVGTDVGLIGTTGRTEPPSYSDVMPPLPPAPPAPPPTPTYLGDRARQDGILYDVTALDGSQPASVVGSGGPATVGDASQKSTDELKKEIDALCYIYESIIPAFGSQQLKAEKQIVLRSSSRPVVMAFYQQLMNMVRQHFQSSGMRVGVIVSPESMGMGAGGAGGGGSLSEGSPLPGFGSNVRINRHGDNVLDQEADVRRESQGVLRGGRNYRSIIQSRIPTNLPELKTAPSRLPLMRSFANTPMPGRIRIAKHSIAGINLR